MTLHGDGLTVGDLGQPLRVLLIADAATDEDLVLRLLRDRFPHAQLRLHVEDGLENTLRWLTGNHVDLILADLSSAKGQGEETLGAVQTAYSETPLMVVTGYGEGDLGLWARVEGAGQTPPRGRPDEDAHVPLDLARGILDALDAPTCAIDSDSRVVAANTAWRDFAKHNGGTAEPCGMGCSHLGVCDHVEITGCATCAPDAGTVARGIRQVINGDLDLFRHSYACDTPNERRWFNVRVTSAAINGGRGAVITHLDMTGLRQIEQTLEHQSMHDALTGLPNRALLVDRLAQAVSDADRRGHGVAVAHLDLSNFQAINGMLQYSGGDGILVEVAQRLLAQLSPGDTLAHVSGDEFLVLWRDLDLSSAAPSLALGEGLLETLAHPFGTADTPVPISGNIGIAWHVTGQSVDRTLQAAGLALAEAKSRGTNNVAMFTGELEEAIIGRTTLEMELRMALNGPITQFVLYYQPVVDLTSGNVVAVESLVRWEHPVLGLVGPDRFIPIAEATGLIQELGGWVLDQAIRDAAALTHRGRELDIAVNFSVLQLDDQAVPQVQRALESSGLRPGRLILEVTESALAEDENVVVKTLEALSQLGVKVAIDDFGTGYSSLHYLRRYPIDTIKIDREFVAGIGINVDDEAICQSIVSLAAAVGATTVGEGVETAEQSTFLRALGCQQGQGFLWAPPVPVQRLDATIAACADVLALEARSLAAQSPRARTPQ